MEMLLKNEIGTAKAILGGISFAIADAALIRRANSFGRC